MRNRSTRPIGRDVMNDGSIPKPDEFLALHDVTAELFELLKRWFGVPPFIELDLSAIDAAVVELGDPTKVAAMAMRKLQALHLLSTPGVRTTSDVVVTIVQDLQRALVQAPVMRLKLQASRTDWDEEFTRIERCGVAPGAINADDPEIERYAQLCGGVFDAMHAVVRVSGGQICELW
jgi:hypothetical protein